ncbi:hypothetical protein BDV28DRAFT_147732 [Aspergillus coremiiformis]|uniref:Uncharacterized protein n=1 Tax=Aspergillus coremiiformis TaxID=138285 RepID=A0A5N6Z819_9EURO|nr:hypothetical protein BDV28DRAFT_147732 [Aspergillus coremiiformis]
MSCYGLVGGSISPRSDKDSPCGVQNFTNPHVPCCQQGDYCMTNAICYWSSVGDFGYYAAGCTDPTLQDPNCGHPELDIVYVKSRKLWACCNYSGGIANCSSPSDERFPAPAPSQLAVIQYLPYEGTPTYANPTGTATGNSTYATATPTASDSTSTPSSDQSTQIGAGAAAGIGVGVGAGVFLVAMAGAFVYFRRRKSPQHAVSPPMQAASQSLIQDAHEPGKPGPNPHELA